MDNRINTLEELRDMDLSAFGEMNDDYIQLQGLIEFQDLVETQYGAVKVVSMTWSAILEQPAPWPCDLCRSLDGKTLPVGHPDFEMYQPPLHDKGKCLWIGSTTESPYKPPIDWKPPDKGLVEKFGNFIRSLPEKEVAGIVEVPKELKKLLPEKEWLKSLSVEEKEAFEYWSSGKYNLIRKYQQIGIDAMVKQAPNPAKARKMINKIIKKHTEVLEKALDRAQPYKGNIFRGLHSLDDKAVQKILKSEVMEWNALSSAGYTEKDALLFVRQSVKGKTGVLFKIKNKTGVKINKAVSKIFESEHEVLMRKGTRYRQISRTHKVFQGRKYWEIELEEIVGKELPKKTLPEIIKTPKVIPKTVPKAVPKVVKPKISPMKWRETLSIDEKEAYKAWFEIDYKDIKKVQRGIKVKRMKKVQKWIDDMNISLDRAPTYTGKVYRGAKDMIEEEFNRLIKSQEIELKGFSSSTKSLQKAKEFAMNEKKNRFSVLYEIRKSKTAVDVSKLSPYIREQEVLLRKGTRYKVLDIKYLKPNLYGSKGTAQIIMEEIPW